MYEAIIARKRASGVEITLLSVIALKASGILSTAINNGPEPGLLAQRLTSIAIFAIRNCPRVSMVRGSKDVIDREICFSFSDPLGASVLMIDVVNNASFNTSILEMRRGAQILYASMISSAAVSDS
jgi:hypothetical protein